jgi:hypothetical protein
MSKYMITFYSEQGKITEEYTREFYETAMELVHEGLEPLMCENFALQHDTNEASNIVLLVMSENVMRILVTEL